MNVTKRTALVLGSVVVASLIVLGLTAFKATKVEHKQETVTINNATVSSEAIGGYTSKIETGTKNLVKTTTAENRVVYFVHEVDFNSSRKAVDELKLLDSQDSKTPIYLLIDSPGGSVIDGAAVISQIEASKAPVYTVCTRLCASMAAMIHSYGTKRYSLDRALLMYHPASAGVQGQVPNMLSVLKMIQRYIDKMNANIISRSKLTQAQFSQAVAYELWLDAEDSLRDGLIEGIIHLNVPSLPANEQGQLQEKQFQPNPTPTTTPGPSRRQKFNVDMIWTN